MKDNAHNKKINAEVRALIDAGRVIDAIRYAKDNFKLGLKEAKDYVDGIRYNVPTEPLVNTQIRRAFFEMPFLGGCNITFKTGVDAVTLESVLENLRKANEQLAIVAKNYTRHENNARRLHQLRAILVSDDED